MRIVPVSTLHEPPTSQPPASRGDGVINIRCSSLRVLSTSRIFEANLAGFGALHGYVHSRANILGPRTENPGGIFEMYSTDAWHVAYQFCLELPPESYKDLEQTEGIESQFPCDENVW